MNLLKQIQKNEKFQSNIYSLLFEKDENSKNKTHIKKCNIERNKNRKLFSNKISKKCNSLLTNIYDKINLINDKSEQINKLNSKSLLKISKEYYRMNNTKSLKFLKNNNMQTMNSTQSTNYFNSSNNFHKKNYNTIIVNQKKIINQKILKQNKLKSEKNIRTIEPYQSIKKNYENNNNKRIVSALVNIKKNNDKLKNFASIDFDELYRRKDDKLVNMERLNDAFRIEMNNTFYRYNPKIHIKKLNEMQRDNISLRQNMEKIKEKINNKVGDLRSKKNIIKRYNEIKNLKNKNIIQPTKTTEENKNPIEKKFKNKGYIHPYGFKARAIYSYKAHSLEKERNKEKNKKINSVKELNPLKLLRANNDIISKILKKLTVSLDTKNILNYIDETKREKVDKNEEIIEYKKDKYFPILKEIKNYLKEYQLNKINYKEIDKEKLEKKIIDIENKLLKNIKDNKKKMIENIEIMYK